MTVPKTTVTLHLKGQTWTLQVAVHSETLDLELKEQTQGTKYDAHLSSSCKFLLMAFCYNVKLDHLLTRWHNAFPSIDLEQLTKKTGNYKRFSVFVEMLLSALEVCILV